MQRRAFLQFTSAGTLAVAYPQKVKDRAAQLPAADFVRFAERAKKCHPLVRSMVTGGRGQNQPPEYRAAVRAQPRVDLERRFEYARKVLDVGIRWRT